MTLTTLFIVARLRVGRALRNIYDGVMAGETWAVGIAIVLAVVVLAGIGYFAFQVYQESATESDEVDLTAEERSMMNRF